MGTALIACSIAGATLPQSAAHAENVVRTSPHLTHPASASQPTVWLCHPGMADDPCASDLTTTVVSASGSSSITHTAASQSSNFDCFYLYPTVSRELTTNADLRIQKTEIAAAASQASRFSSVCRVWAPIYRQVTLAGLDASPGLAVNPAATAIAYDSVRVGFEEYLDEFNDGRPIVFIGHSQGAAMLIMLLAHLADDTPSLRHRLVLAIILGGNVEVLDGELVGGTFSHIPLCDSAGESGCVIAYSSFPGEPPSSSLFGRPGQGVSLQSGQTKKGGLMVACTNPAALGGTSATLDPFFPSQGSVPTPWVEYPDLYTARCESGDGAAWLQVTKSSGVSDQRPVVTEQAGPDWGFHVDDANLALGNLVADVAAAEVKWLRSAT